MNFKQKRLWTRLFFYCFLLILLLLIPIIYGNFFITYGIEMLLFVHPFYIIGEFIGIYLINFWAEYYFFVKKNIEIKDKSLRNEIIAGLSFFLVFVSKIIFLWLF